MMIRSLLFRIAYWVVSAFFAITALPLLILPTRNPLGRWIRLYTKIMVFLMKNITGINLTIKGRGNIPAGPCIIAAKHQSWGDGFCIFSEIDDLAFVAGDHLDRIPLIGGIVRKLGAIIVDNCGGAVARARLIDEELTKAQAQQRRILIYPEGHLAPVGEKYRYKRGVYHIYAAYNQPVVPVATNLGLFWPQMDFVMHPGEAVLEFLDPIEPGLDKEAFMARLEMMIETHSLALLDDKAKAAKPWDRPALPDPIRKPARAKEAS